MNQNIISAKPKLLKTLGLGEEPMGIFYSDNRPVEGFTPEPMDLPKCQLKYQMALHYLSLESGQGSGCQNGSCWLQ
jgi:hypothetical protein